jgi:class 3 adenylate cyclase
VSTILPDASRPLASITLLGSVTQRAANVLRVPIVESSFTVGRDKDNHLSLPKDAAISRHHCVIETVAAGFLLRDLNSSNGTYLNGKRVQGAVPLPLPAQLTLGQTRLLIARTDAGSDAESRCEQATLCGSGSIVIPAKGAFQRRSEAFLVVDVIGSTQLVKQNERQFAATIAALGKIIEHAMHAEPEPFLQCTGDGFFACFGKARTALETALELGAQLTARRVKPPPLSVALHWGSASFAPTGERTGQDVHGVFALEKLRHAEPRLAAARPAAGDRPLVVMSAPFWLKLTPAHQKQTEPMGRHRLKGLDEEIQVFCWRA